MPEVGLHRLYEVWGRLGSKQGPKDYGSVHRFGATRGRVGIYAGQRATNQLHGTDVDGVRESLFGRVLLATC